MQGQVSLLQPQPEPHAAPRRRASTWRSRTLIFTQPPSMRAPFSQGFHFPPVLPLGIPSLHC